MWYTQFVTKMVIVTGITGFVGQRLAPKLVKRFGVNNILFLVYKKDKSFSSKKLDYLKKIKAKVKYVDLLKRDTLIGLPKNPNLVIHLAASTDTSLKDHRVNNTGTVNFYDSLGKLDVRTHVIHVGTMVAVSGRPNCKKPIDENTPDFPTNEYTRTKVAGEKYIWDKAIKENLSLTVIRPNTIYGKAMRKGSLFDMLASEIRKNSLISKINWPGKSALIHVDDVVKYILYFADKKPSIGKPEKYLLYSENLTISDLNKILYKKMKKTYKEIKLPAFFWKIAALCRCGVPLMENFLRPDMYNQLWRASIVVDNVVWCKTNKISRINNKRFLDHSNEVIN